MSTVAFQPSLAAAFEASPIRASTSAALGGWAPRREHTIDAAAALITGLIWALTSGVETIVTLPGDVAELEAQGATPPHLTTRAPELVPAQEDVQALADAINAAGTVAFFVGESAGFVSGQVLYVAGGPKT